MADADEIELSFGPLPIEDRFHLRVVQHRTGGGLEERGAGQFDAPLGHSHLAFPSARLLQFGIESEVGLELPGDLLFAAPRTQILWQAGDDRGGGFRPKAGDRLREGDLRVAFRRRDGGGDRRQQGQLVVAQVFDQAQLRLQGGQERVEEPGGRQGLAVAKPETAGKSTELCFLC